MAKAPREYRSFTAFWPHYLREHARPQTRALHYIGTSLVIALAVLGAITGRWTWFIVMPIAGYFFAWIGHFLIEKNRPATFTYPIWSLAADFKMWWCWLTGKIDRELAAANVSRG